MRQNNLSLWKYNSSLNCLLFFAQRLDELLFHHTTDTYRNSTLSLQGLAVEYCKVYKDVQNGILNKKNLAYIIDEFSERLKNDTILKEILTEEFVERFLKNYASWTTKEQYENIRYIGRTFGNRHYYNHIVSKLKELIKENKKKKELDEKTSLFVRELLDCGYNANYIFQMLHEVFFHKEVSSLDSLNVFLAKFDFVEKKYDVYIGYSSDMSSLLPLFDKLDSSDIKISVINTAEVPIGIKTRRQKTILKFESIECYDMYTAFDIADAIFSCVVNSYYLYSHPARPYNQPPGMPWRKLSQGTILCPDSGKRQTDSADTRQLGDCFRNISF